MKELEGIRDSEPSPAVAIIVPAFNEAAKIGSVVAELLERFPTIVVVDDGSSDETSHAARSAGAAAVRHPVNRGQGAALQTGFAWALVHGADAVVTFDADGQHSVDDIPRLLSALGEGPYDVALGSRFLGAARDISSRRRLMLKGAVLFTRLTSGLPLTDTHNGLRAFRASALERIRLRFDRMAHASEIIDQIGRLGLTWVEVPVEIRYTEYSRRKGQGLLAPVRVLTEYIMGRLLG